MEAKGSMRLFVKKNSLKLFFLSSCIDRGHGWAATAVFACATQWLHADIPKRGLSNDEKADFKGNCIRFIGASIRVCEKKIPWNRFFFCLNMNRGQTSRSASYSFPDRRESTVNCGFLLSQEWQVRAATVGSCFCRNDRPGLNRRLTQIFWIARIASIWDQAECWNLHGLRIRKDYGSAPSTRIMDKKGLWVRFKNFSVTLNLRWKSGWWICGSEDAALNRRFSRIERIARISQSA